MLHKPRACCEERAGQIQQQLEQHEAERDEVEQEEVSDIEHVEPTVMVSAGEPT